MSIALSLPPELAFAVEITAKATLALLATAAAAGVVALRGGSAAARHLVWTLGVCGVLALPLFSASLPGWRTPLLTIPAVAAAAPTTFAAEPVIARPVAQGRGAVAQGTNAAPAAAAPVAVQSGADAAANGMGMGTIAVAIYLLGMLLVLGRLAIGRWSLARLGRQAEPVGDAAWTGLLRDLTWELGIGRPVRLLRGGGATMPMTWGIAHPTVLLPAESAEWPEERRRVVLMHELAHVARHDCLTQTLAAAACALYWFHPAAWYAARRLRVERELACDDRVLQTGTRARDYAAHLLEVARAFRPAPLAGPVAVSMARPSQLEGRLLAVLDGVRNRRMPGRAAAACATTLALALVLPLAAIRPGNAQQAVPAGVTFGGPKPWKDTVKAKPPRSADAYPDLDAARRAGASDVSIPARPGERLTLRLPEGVSARVLAWDRPSVHVRVDDPGLRVRGERGPGGVHVTVTGRPRGDGGTEPHVRIQAPREFSVDAVADGGGLEIGALRGTFTGSVTNGGLAFQGTRGRVRMSARGGGAFISRTHLEGRLEMDGGGVLLDRNTGNLDITGAGGTVVGRPGGTLRVVPGRAGRDEDDDVDCAGAACTITVAPARGTALRTTVATSAGTRTISGRATTVTAAPTRGTSVAVASAPARTTITTTVPARAVRSGVTVAPARTSTVVATAPARTTVSTTVGTHVTGRAATSDVAVASGGSRVSATTAPTRVSGSATTVTTWDDDVATAGGGQGSAYLTGDVPGRISALRAMARNAPPAAAAQGIGRLAFTEPDERVQRAAVDELARLRTRQATKQLESIARSHPNAAIRARAEAALR